MNKKEFLKELKNKLNKKDYDDVDGILDYYDELIEDRIERTNEDEESVIEELGSIDDIVSRVVGKNNEKIKYDEVEEKETKKEEKKISFGLLILIAILTSPIWLGLLGTAIGINVGVFGAGLGISVAGIACIGFGMSAIFTATTKGLILLGVGSILIGVAFIIVPLLTRYAKFLVRIVKVGFKWVKEKICSYKEEK